MNRDSIGSSDPYTDADLGDAEARRLRDLIFDQAPLGMTVVDTAGVILRVNEAAGAMVGRRPDTLVGRNLSDVVHRADGAGVLGQFHSLMAGTLEHLRAETRLVHDDGSVIWICVHASCVRDADGAPLFVFAQIEDITEERRAVAALAQAEERFRTTFEQAPIGMILTDGEGVLLRCNPAFGTIVGRSPADLMGTTVRDMTHPEDLAFTIKELEALLSGAVGTYSIEKRYIHADGHVVWVSVSASCVRDSDGSPLYLIGQIEDVTERREMRERLAHAAIHDPLTDLPNRDLFIDRLDMAVRRARRGGHRVAVMFIDLDRFKMVNDNLGHEVGDRLLRAVADRMSGALRASDTLARFGGDEFTVLCDEVRDEAHVLEIADRLRATMAEPLELVNGETFVSFSVGVALSTDGSESGATLLRHADIAMYRAKEGGPARVEIYSEDDHTRMRRRLRKSDQLGAALERHEFELFYQPFVDLRSETMVGLEALVRWRHPSRGLLLPEDFMAGAEDSGQVVALGAWALEQAARQLVLWGAARDAAGQDPYRLHLSVNVSARQLSHPGFTDMVVDVLDRTGADPDRLWLEFSESTIMRDADIAVGLLQGLRHMGLHFVIDDFGTGYSSLTYLKRLPVESLKIDRSFLNEVDRRSEDAAIVRAIIGLGDSLGLSVIAEGVERAAQVRRLVSLGCNLGQGYLFGNPQPAADFGAFPADTLRTDPRRAGASSHHQAAS